MYFLAHCINASVLVQDPDLFRYSFNLLEQTKKRSVPGASGGPDAALGGGLKIGYDNVVLINMEAPIL